MRAFGHAVSGPEGRLSRSDRRRVRRGVGRERGFGASCWPERAGCLFEQPRCDQPRGGGVLLWTPKGVWALQFRGWRRPLVVSERAVEKHVTAILPTLDLPPRWRTIDECWPCSRSCAPRSPTLSAGRRWPAAPSIGPRPGSRCSAIRAGGYARAGAGDLANGRREAVTAQRTSGEAAPAVGREPGRRALGEEPHVWNVYGCIRGRRRDSVLGHSTRPSSSLWRHRHRAGRDRGPRR